MDRDVERSDDTIQEGGLVIEERMNRREGLVEYEGTVEGADRSGDAMQAGAAVLAGTGSTALVDDAATMAGGGQAGGAGSARGTSDTIPTMSTDNTAATADTADGGFLPQVREGMKVFDAGGDEVGKVDYIRAGDPQAATTMGQESRGDLGGDVIAPVGSASGAGTGAGSGLAIGGVVGTGGDLGDVDEPFRSQLLRSGFFRVDGKGRFDTERYITPDQIASVSGDGVTLTRHKDDLIRE